MLIFEKTGEALRTYNVLTDELGNDVEYHISWFHDPAHRSQHGVIDVAPPIDVDVPIAPPSLVDKMLSFFR